MIFPDSNRSQINGVLFLVAGLFIISLQDVTVKSLGGVYPVLEIVTFRSLTALPLAIFIFHREGGKGLPKTKKHKWHMARGLLFFLSYTTHFMGLASLPLVEVAAIRYSGPLLITLFSVLLLSEKVSLKHWAAIVAGFFGILIIVKPGLGNFNLGSLYIIISVILYALGTIITRIIKDTEKSSVFAYYSTIMYMAGAVVLIPITLAIGEASEAPPGIVFLLKSWSVPSFLDWLIMSGLGFIWTGTMYCLAQAYRLAPPSIAAPFEYVSMPINIIWGLALWNEIPSVMTLAGAALALLSGLYILRLGNRKLSRTETGRRPPVPLPGPKDEIRTPD